jgi:hypothetical protein
MESGTASGFFLQNGTKTAVSFRPSGENQMWNWGEMEIRREAKIAGFNRATGP